MQIVKTRPLIITSSIADSAIHILPSHTIVSVGINYKLFANLKCYTCCILYSIPLRSINYTNIWNSRIYNASAVYIKNFTYN